jgi:hypothetical protein
VASRGLKTIKYRQPKTQRSQVEMAAILGHYNFWNITSEQALQETWLGQENAKTFSAAIAVLPQAEFEALEKLILAGRDLAPQYTLPFRVWTLCLQKFNFRNGILGKQNLTVPGNGTVDHREKKSCHNTGDRTQTA